MKDNEDFDGLNWAVEYRVLRNKVRLMAGIVIIIGVIASLFLLFTLLDSSGNIKTWDIPIMILGLLLLVIGIVSFRSPKPSSLILQGGILLLFLCAIVFGLLVEGIRSSGPTSPEFATGVGVLIGLIGLIVRNILMYSRFAKIPTEQLNIDQVKWVDQTIEEINKAKSKKVSDIITFKTEGASWQAKLTKDLGFFLKNGRHVVLSRKREVEFVPQREVRPGKKVKASFCFGNHKLKGKIRSEFFQLYQEWKLGTNTHRETKT